MTQRTRRPRNTHKDENHSIVTDFMKYGCGGFTVAPKELRGDMLAYTANYHGRTFIAFDFANAGGVITDWLVICLDNQVACWLEVKTPEAYAAKEHSVTPGEAWLMFNTGMVEVVVTVEDVRDAFEGMIG